MIIERANESELDQLTELWERSVRATHAFLSSAQIDALRPLVRHQALPSIEIWVARAEEGCIAGFMGLTQGAVDALFIDPNWFNRGVGRRLLDHAFATRGPLTVDVNEQNPSAIEFYEKYGFEAIGRSAVDSGGRPFPIIHMAMPRRRKQEDRCQR